MTDIRIGGLFEGYGGLTMAVRAVFGGQLAWYSEWEPPTKAAPRPTQAPARLLAAHHPGVPNLGDVSAVDWSVVPQVHILCGGFPCQDLSHAGKRLGLRPGTRSGMWEHFAYAISTLRPNLVVIENVRGLLSAEAHGDVEPCPWCVGDDPDGALRALGAVLADLAALGYDAEWGSVRASDVGAPHARLRVFVLAWPRAADAGGAGWEGGGFAEQAGWAVAAFGAAADAADERRDWARCARPGGTGSPDDDRGHGRAEVPDADCSTGGQRRLAAPGQAEGGRSRANTGRRVGAPVADAQDGGQPGEPGCALGGELGAARPDAGGIPVGDRPRAGGRTLAGDAAEGVRLLGGRADGAVPDASGDGRDEGRPEPAGLVGGPDAAERGATAADPSGERHGGGQEPGLVGRVDGPDEGDPRQRERARPVTGDRGPAPIEWGPYAAAIGRWERGLGRLAPPPTVPGPKGAPRLNPVFVEWMMGLPVGHVTDPALGLTRNEQLKLLGNGVCPQQAEAAIRALWARVTAPWSVAP